MAETTALAGSTTESLRNIELVKSMGLAQQEVERLNRTTQKILKLELKKVRYLRSLSFVQGTSVNALRTSILFLMLYLIFTQQITVGQFFSLWIYSFFIFGPLQEMGTVINLYRETEVSLQNFQEILDTPREPRPANPVPVASLEELAFEGVTFTHQAASQPAVRDISFQSRARGHAGLRGPLGRGQDHAREAARRALSPAGGAHPLQRRGQPRGGHGAAARADRLRHPGDAAVLGHHPREPGLRPARRHRRRVPGGPAPRRLRGPAGPGREGAGHRHRRRRDQGVGRRAPAPLDRARPPAPARPAGLRRGHLLARLPHRGGDQPHHPGGGGVDAT